MNNARELIWLGMIAGAVASIALVHIVEVIATTFGRLRLYRIEARRRIPVDRIAHAEGCPVNMTQWTDCNCGLFAGYGKPVTREGGHAESCPCHCRCDFMNRLRHHFYGDTE